MATENQPESSQAENQELPTPEFSENGASSPSGGSADEIVSKLTPVIEQIVQRTVQSTKDKRISKIEKALGGRLDLLAELEEQGVSIPKEVRTEMQIRELQERISQPDTQPAPVRDDGASQPKTAVTEAIAKLNEYGLSSNDPAFIEVLRGKYLNKDAFDKAVLGHIVGKLAPQKPANPADVVQSPATRGADTNTAAQIERGYLEEISKVPRGNTHAVSQVKSKWRKIAKDAGLQLNV